MGKGQKLIMPTHAEQRFLPYAPEKLYDLVADIEHYPAFLPWCVGARILSREDNVIYAEMMIGFKMIRETFTSKVTLHAPDRVDVDYQKGPFKHLKNHWEFKFHPDGCLIDFYIDFEFRSRILRNLIEPLFNEAVRRMVSAFEVRARSIYGEPVGAVPRNL
jgi:coenzyme Q-binding protein COQ10